MCMFKSGIILKDRVFVPDYDHHTEMLEELKIKDTEKNAQNLFVRAELIPENGDVFTPIETWRFNVDQDIVPDWFVAEYERERMVAAVKEWAKSHIHIGKDNLVIDAGRNHYIKDCKNVVIKGSASISEVYGSASISKVCDSAMIASSPYSNWSNKDKVIISENATFKDNQTKTIWQSGDWKVQMVNTEEK